MTRLKEEWIKDMRRDVEAQQNDLLAKTGLDYAALAARAAGLTKERVAQASRRLTVAVVPVTAGKGVIGSFAESVSAILGATGFQSFVTGCTDVSGVLEAHRRGAGVIFMADDSQFIALNTERNLAADNNTATTLGFLAALEAAAGGLEGKSVLVLGCGVIGVMALTYLRSKGACPVGYDTDGPARDKAAALGFDVVTDGPEGFKRYPYVFDATNTGGWLTESMLHPEAFIAAPGVPLSLTEAGLAAVKGRLVHDLLPIGVATMMGMACGAGEDSK